MDELTLISNLVNDDRRSFDVLVDTYKDRVYNTSLAFVQNKNDAEDLTQEVFLEIFLSIKHFKKQSKLSTWIYRITVTKALDHLRSKKRKKRFAFVTDLFNREDKLIHDPPDFVHPGVKIENKELSSILFKAISKLTKNQKIAFTLNKIEGLNYREISEIMNITVSSVESLLFRARQKLRALLTEYYKS